MKTIAVAACLGGLVAHRALAAVVGCDDAAAIEKVCEGRVAAVICIDDFAYDPAIVSVAVGDTVAWVNVENACQEREPETGCDTHHEIVTDPMDQPASTDLLEVKRICSPFPGTTGRLVRKPPARCDELLDTNVACHTFRTPGTQHYGCHTDDAHRALMHGVVIVE